MVTAELAVAIVGLVMVLGICLYVVAIGIAEIRVHEAARACARSLARGDPHDAALSAARKTVPGSRVEAVVADSEVRVSVRVPVEIPAGGLNLAPITAQADAYARFEVPVIQ